MKPSHPPFLSHPLLLTLLAALTLVMSGCAVVGGIFKAGVWVGVLAVFFVLGLIGWAIKSALT